MIEEAVTLVDVDYFLGRCCFILSKGKQYSTQLYIFLAIRHAFSLT